MEHLPRSTLSPSPRVTRCGESPGDRGAISHSRYLLPPSTPCWELGQLLHKATTLPWAGESGLSLLAGCPHCTVPRAALSRAGSQHSAPRAQPTAGESHVPSTCPAWLAAVLTALSPVPCRVSQDMTTTRTPGCSGWAPAIASSPSGSARYGPCQEGGPGTTGMFQPYSLWLLCRSTPSAFWAACPP